MSKTCCICFFGAMRTLPQTIDTIKKVIQQFKELYDVKIFVHTWKDQDFKLLEPDYYRTTDQEQFKKLKVPEHLTVYYATYSRKQVTLLALSKIPNPELVVYIRPDTFFKTIDILSLIKQFNYKSKQIQIITPDFDNFYWDTENRKTKGSDKGKRGTNDRFAICLGSSAAKVYVSQYDHLDEIKKEKIDFIGEIILEWVFLHYNVLNIRSPMCFYLLRSDGKKHGWCKEDLKNRYKQEKK